MKTSFDDLSIHLLSVLASIPIKDLVESEKLINFVEDVEELIEIHRNKQSKVRG